MGRRWPRPPSESRSSLMCTFGVHIIYTMTVRDKSQEEESPIMCRIKEMDSSIARIARFVGVRRATVSDWVNKKTAPNLDPEKMFRLQVALECESLSELISLFQPDLYRPRYAVRREWDATK